MNPFSEHTTGETPKDQMAGNVCESRPSSPDRVNASTVPGGRQKRGKTGKYLANFQWGRNRFDMICDGVTASSGWSKGRLKNRPNIICRKRRQRGSVLPRPGHLRPEPQGGLTHNASRLPRQGRKETTLAGTQWRPRRPKDLVVEVVLRGDPVCRYVKPDMLVDVALKQVVDPGAVPGGSTTFNGPAAWKVADTRREAPRGRRAEAESQAPAPRQRRAPHFISRVARASARPCLRATRGGRSRSARRRSPRSWPRGSPRCPGRSTRRPPGQACAVAGCRRRCRA